MVRSWKTRRFIIEKTAHLFNKQGYAGTHMSDLTKATGLTKGSIYGNFKDKNEVAVEAFRYNFKRQAKWFLERINKVQRADEKLMAYVFIYRAEHEAIYEHGGCPILNTAVDSDDGNPDLKKEVTQALNGWMDHLENIINTGIEKGELIQTDAHAFALHMISLIEGGVMLSNLLNNNEALLQNINMLEVKINEIATH